MDGENTELLKLANTVGRDDILNFRFPTKLWILCNSSNTAVKWAEDESSIFIDFTALDKYLESNESIFKTRYRSSFIRQLNFYRFQKFVPIKENADPNIIFGYRHEHFLKRRPDLVFTIVRSGSNAAKSQRVESGIRKISILRKSIQTKGKMKLCRKTRNFPLPKRPAPENNHDLSNKRVFQISDLELARLELRLNLDFNRKNQILAKQLAECAIDSSEPVIELPADEFLNPSESTWPFEDNPEYAGFYGKNISTEEVKKFFGDYLPTYQDEDDADICNENDEDIKELDQLSETNELSTSPILSYFFKPKMDKNGNFELNILEGNYFNVTCDGPIPEETTNNNIRSTQQSIEPNSSIFDDCSSVIDEFLQF